jgi:hypothetical protein
MLDREKVLAVYNENYQMAIEDGHQHKSTRIAWEQTEEQLIQEFLRIRATHHWGNIEAVNKAFFS